MRYDYHNPFRGFIVPYHCLPSKNMKFKICIQYHNLTCSASMQNIVTLREQMHRGVWDRTAEKNVRTLEGISDCRKLHNPVFYHLHLLSAGYRSQYSNWLWAGQSRGKNYLSSMLSSLALGPTQTPIQWVLWDFSWG
jgi:hypothetical protein